MAAGERGRAGHGTGTRGLRSRGMGAALHGKSTGRDVLPVRRIGRDAGARPRRRPCARSARWAALYARTYECGREVRAVFGRGDLECAVLLGICRRVLASSALEPALNARSLQVRCSSRPMPRSAGGRSGGLLGSGEKCGRAPGLRREVRSSSRASQRSDAPFARTSVWVQTIAVKLSREDNLNV